MQKRARVGEMPSPSLKFSFNLIKCDFFFYIESKTVQVSFDEYNKYKLGWPEMEGQKSKNRCVSK